MTCYTLYSKRVNHVSKVCCLDECFSFGMVFREGASIPCEYEHGWLGGWVPPTRSGGVSAGETFFPLRLCNKQEKSITEKYIFYFEQWSVFKRTNGSSSWLCLERNTRCSSCGILFFLNNKKFTGKDIRSQKHWLFYLINIIDLKTYVYPKHNLLKY